MNSQKALPLSLLALSTLMAAASPAFAATAPALGTAAKFALLSAAPTSHGAVTCTDGNIRGNIGSTGARPAVVMTRCPITGQIIAPVTPQVVLDFNRAYTALSSNRCEHLLTGTLAGVVLPPGVYCFTAAAVLTGTVTLNGPATGVWIFLVNGDLTGNTFTTSMAGYGKACNVYWSPSGASTMTDSNFKGNVLAGQAATFTRGTFTGRALAKAGVTATKLPVVGCANLF